MCISVHYVYMYIYVYVYVYARYMSELQLRKKAPTGLQNNCINENKLPNKINAAVSTNSEIPQNMLKIIGKRASAPFS